MIREPANLQFPKRQFRQETAQAAPDKGKKGASPSKPKKKPMFKGERISVNNNKRRYPELDEEVIAENMRRNKLAYLKQKKNKRFLNDLSDAEDSRTSSDTEDEKASSNSEEDDDDLEN